MVDETKRTIEEVFDKQNQELILEKDFFKKSEAEIEKYRIYLEEGIQLGQPRFVCSHCGQAVKLCGRVTQKGKVSYFSHLYDSEDCDLKTTTGLSREEIMSKMYGASADGSYTRSIREYLYEKLSTESSGRHNISSVSLEPRIGSDVPYLHWRRPDVYAEIGGRKVVFELQISPTFLGLIVDRDIFYRLNGYYVMWIFDFDAIGSNFSLANLTAKDIYYANKRNVFILDDDAREASDEQDRLCLSVTWRRPDGTFAPKQTIPVDELLFDDETFKPYYYDADAEYYALHPEEKDRIVSLERSRKELGEALKAKVEQDRLRNERKNLQIVHCREQMAENGGCAEPYSKSGRWGYAYNGTVLTEPLWTSVTPIENGNYGKVFKGRRWGLVDRLANEVLPCEYKGINVLPNGQILLNDGKHWLLGLNKHEIARARADDILETSSLSDELCLVKIKSEKDSLVLVVDQDGGSREFDEIGAYEGGSYNVRLKGHWSGGYSERVGDFWEYTKKSYVYGNWALMSEKGIVYSTSSKDQVANDLKGRRVIINQKGEPVSDFFRRDPKILGDGLASINDGNGYGLLVKNSDGHYVMTIPCIYEEELVKLDSTRVIYRVKNGETYQYGWMRYTYLLGLISIDGDILTEAVYQDLKLGENGQIMVRIEADGPYGALDENYRLVAGFVKELAPGLAIYTSCCRLGVLNDEGKVIVPYRYGNIEMVSEKLILADDKLLGVNGEIKMSFVASPKLIGNGIICLLHSGRTELYTKDFEQIIPSQYGRVLSVGGFNDGLAIVCLEDKEHGGQVDCKMTEDGEILTEDIRTMLNGVILCTKYGRRYVRNSDGELFDEFSLDDAIDLSENYVLAISPKNVMILNGSLQKIDSISGENLRFYRRLTDSTSLVLDDDSMILINSANGKVLLKASGISLLRPGYIDYYDTVWHRSYSMFGYGDGYNQQHHGVITEDGKKIVPKEYSEITIWGDLLICHGINEGMALYTLYGKQLTYAFGFVKLTDNIAKVEEHHSYALYGSEGKALTKPLFTEVELLSDKYIALQRYKYWALYDIESGDLSECKYEKIRLDNSGAPILIEGKKPVTNDANKIQLKGTQQTGHVTEILPFGIIIKLAVNGKTYLVHESVLAAKRMKPDDFKIEQEVCVNIRNYDNVHKRWILELYGWEEA